MKEVCAIGASLCMVFLRGDSQGRAPFFGNLKKMKGTLWKLFSIYGEGNILTVNFTGIWNFVLSRGLA
jgi:hypothetical protein